MQWGLLRLLICGLDFTFELMIIVNGIHGVIWADGHYGLFKR